MAWYWIVLICIVSYIFGILTSVFAIVDVIEKDWNKALQGEK